MTSDAPRPGAAPLVPARPGAFPAVPLLDLRAQYETIRDEVRPALERIVESQAFVLGPEVEAFETEIAEYLREGHDAHGTPHAPAGDAPSDPSHDAPIDASHCVACASGTDALLLPLMALDPEPGDEVVVPAFTFFATAGAVWNAGFRPAFCDVDPDTFNVTRATLEEAWTDRVRAVIPVHLFGQMAPMEEVLDVAAGRVLVLEDAAQAIGARRNGGAAGTLGDCGAFSFFPTKNLGGFGDGGMIVARDPTFAERLRKLRVHGGRQMYHHEMVGTNSRLDALQAAILRVKLDHLEGWTEARRRNARRYDEMLAGVDGVRTPVTDAGNHHTYNQYTLRVVERDGLREFLSSRCIGTGVYYPVPLHLQECFAELGYGEGDLPVSEGLCRDVVSLPVFAELGGERLERVAGAIREFYGAD